MKNISSNFVSVINQDVQILIGGKSVRTFGHDGKTYIEAKKNTEYSIKLKNSGYVRELAVVTVDGLNILDGKPASKDGQGYIIPAYSSYEVKGFRTSNEKVNAFRFNEKEKSYAANNEENDYSTQNCGVIGVVFFAEKIKTTWNYTPPPKPKTPFVPSWPSYPTQPWIYPDYPSTPEWDTYKVYCQTTTTDATTQYRCSDNASQTRRIRIEEAANQAPVSCFAMNAAPMDLGTEFSDKEIDDRVTESAFDRGYQLVSFEIYYASRDVLLSHGVPLDKETKISKLPSAFPKDESRFCKPPTKR